MSAAAGSHLVIEREGQLWAVPGDAVEHIERGGGRLTVRLAGAAEASGSPQAAAASRVGALTADRLLAVAAGLTVRRAPGALVRYWSEAAAGVALWARRPVVVIDPAHPPRVLVSQSVEDADG